MARQSNWRLPPRQALHAFQLLAAAPSLCLADVVDSVGGFATVTPSAQRTKVSVSEDRLSVKTQQGDIP